MRRIPSLDGLRAVSIGLVLVAHSIPATQWDWFVWKLVGNGDLGVSIFFVISVFLITDLLLKEQERTDRISLRTFYSRRGFRILPPFLAFMVILECLRVLGVVTFSLREWISALVFGRDYWMAQGWWTAHTWSLSIEEQFY